MNEEEETKMNEFLDVMIKGKSNLERMEMQKRGYDIGKYETLMEIFNLIQTPVQNCFNCQTSCRPKFGLFECGNCGCSWDKSKAILDYVEANLRSEYQVLNSTPLESMSERGQATVHFNQSESSLENN